MVYGVQCMQYADGWQHCECQSFGWILIYTLNKWYSHEIEIICNGIVPYDLSFDHDNWQKSAFEEETNIKMGRHWQKFTKSASVCSIENVCRLDGFWFIPEINYISMKERSYLMERYHTTRVLTMITGRNLPLKGGCIVKMARFRVQI
jgi:hypothetical protein